MSANQPKPFKLAGKPHKTGIPGEKTFALTASTLYNMLCEKMQFSLMGVVNV